MDPDAVLDEICAEVLASLPRRDQRRRGAEYVRGLLVAPGRKTIRGISAVCSGPAGDQSLHHLVSGSTWRWGPVRQALRRHLDGMAPARAWVARPMTIPRSGRRSVGVARCSGPGGEFRLAQQAIGLWACSGTVATPVEWRLRLPAEWLDDAELRRAAAVPDDVRAESVTESVVATCAAAVRGGDAGAPLVVDATTMDLAALLRTVAPIGLPVLARIDGETPVVVDDADLAGHRAGEVTAGRVVAAAAGRRVHLASGGWMSMVRVRLRTPVHLAAGPGRPPGLLLLAAGRPGHRRPHQMWITDMTRTPPAALLTIGAALDAVEQRERERTAAAVGVGHYGGRSYEAWHRHTTLASVAHAVQELAPARSADRPTVTTTRESTCS